LLLWDESARPNKNIRDIDTATDSALNSENLQLLFSKNIDGFELLLCGIDKMRFGFSTTVAPGPQ
jgi:hypothetical protein